MPENSGLYQKYHVARADGKPEPDGVYFVLNVLSDTKRAIPALQAYADACYPDLPELGHALDALVTELRSGEPGAMVEALRTPKKES
jgi:hypothetical protein